MASPKRTKKKTSPVRHIWSFLAGIGLPFCLVVWWHSAYGQYVTPPQAKAAPSGHATQAKPVSPGTEFASVKPGPPEVLPSAPAVPEPPAARPAPAVSHKEEMAALRRVFQDSVTAPSLNRLEQTKKMWRASPKVLRILDERRQRLLHVDASYYDFVRGDVVARMASSGRSFGQSQYFVYVDRNPSVQLVVIGFYDAGRDRIEILGADLVSSGNLEKGGDYFETPTGVFENMVENFSYRALGTPNQEGWRGLGAKDSRVWDFGDQKSIKKYKNGNTISQMRLLMHSTDPDKGEPRLGRIDSKGCVRISQGLNRFLDAYAILDLNYEDWAKTKPDSWLLKKERTPVATPGKFLIIGDSSLALQAQAKPPTSPGIP